MTDEYRDYSEPRKQAAKARKLVFDYLRAAEKEKDMLALSAYIRAAYELSNRYSRYFSAATCDALTELMSVYLFDMSLPQEEVDEHILAVQASIPTLLTYAGELR